ncbi:MAG TPA: 2Fe-2S iron-sulfur cluster-binding protein, partial [Anaerolineales bacterium]|nr:2Fe-2S iron-sulfur cluster-binding protein [Anaerolineales bacterium]
MELKLRINAQPHELNVSPGDSLLTVLRREGYFGVKHGCETGECGACTVLVEGAPQNSCVLLALQAEGKVVETVES